MRPFFSVLILLTLSLSTAFPQGTITPTGPYGGYVQHLASDSSGRVYAATFRGGIFRTSDDGDTWEDLYDDTLIVDVRTLAIGSGGTIYAGLDPGFMRSTDAGATWQKVNNSLNTRAVVSILILPNGHLLAGTLTSGIYRSTNGGTSFTESSDSLTNFYVWSLAASASGDTVFAATYGGGVFRSVDGGTTWAASNNGLTENLATWVGFAPDGALLACAGDAIFRSGDYGETWSELAAPSAAYRGIAFAPGGWFAPATSGALAGGGVYASTDGGTSWAVEPGLPAQYYLSALHSNGTVFAGAGGHGVYRRPAPSATRAGGAVSAGSRGARTVDAGTLGGWTQVVQGMANTIITSLAFDTAGVLFAGTRFAGVFRSPDSAATWVNVSDSIPPAEWINDIAVSPVTNTVFAAGAYASYRSSDGGATWDELTVGQSQMVAVNGFGTVFSSLGGNIRRSTDDGATWFGQFLSGVSAIRDAAFDDSTVYLATGVGSTFGTSRGIWRSTDDGVTWAAFNDSLTDLNVVAVTVIDTAAALKRAAGAGNCDRLVFGATWSGNVRGLEGDLWLPSTSGSGLGFRPVAFYETKLAEPHWLAGDRGELAEREDLTCDWTTKVSLRLHQEVGAIVVVRGVSEENRVLYGTSGGGVIQFIAKPTAADPEPSLPLRFRLHQNYPNPFNPSTTVRYDVPDPGWVSLKVFDVLGRETAVLVDGFQTPGVKSVKWDAGGAAGGVYFIRMAAGTHRETKKILLLK